MYQSVEDAKLSGALRETLASAVEEYRQALDAIADAADHGRPASPQQLERAFEAMLQLENAEILVELDVDRRRGALPVPPPRSVH
jgi:hypothetical protein